MTDKAKKILIWGSVGVAVVLVAVVIKKAAAGKGVAITIPGLAGITAPAAKKPPFPSQIYYPGIPPTMNNWDGRGGYSYDVGDGMIDYYDKNDVMVVMH